MCVDHSLYQSLHLETIHIVTIWMVSSQLICGALLINISYRSKVTKSFFLQEKTHTILMC
jgi:hypothetical protein